VVTADKTVPPSQAPSAQQDLPGLRPAIRLAQEMARELGRGEDVLGALQGRAEAAEQGGPTGAG